MVKLQAHRGVSSEYPENTLAAFRASIEQGYDIIECDPKYTKDGELVILHDKTINRTGRIGGKAPTDPVPIVDITLAEAERYEYGSWKNAAFKGEKLPRFTDMLDFAAETQIPIKIDNVWEKFPEEIQDKMFKQIKAYGDALPNVGFTCAKLDTLKKAAKAFPSAPLHYDGTDLSDATLKKVQKIAKGHKLYVWVCFDNEMTKWFKGEKASKELCDRVRQYGELGIWILSKRDELPAAINEYGAEIIETTGHIKPEWLKDFS